MSNPLIGSSPWIPSLSSISRRVLEWGFGKILWVTKKDTYSWIFKTNRAQYFHWRVKATIQAAFRCFCRGKIKLKTPEEAMELIENMAASDHAILRDRAHIPTKRSLLELSSQDALLAQNKLLSKQLEALTETLSKLPTQLHVGQSSPSSVLQVAGCVIYGGAHDFGSLLILDLWF